jgi:hypothetical protein
MPDLMPVLPIPLHAPDELVIRIEMALDLANDTDAGSVAYWLEMARFEAMNLSEQKRRDAAILVANPIDIWRPVDR